MSLSDESKKPKKRGRKPKPKPVNEKTKSKILMEKKEVENQKVEKLL